MIRATQKGWSLLLLGPTCTVEQDANIIILTSRHGVRNEVDGQKTDANATEPVKVTYADAVKGKTESKQVKFFLF